MWNLPQPVRKEEIMKKICLIFLFLIFLGGCSPTLEEGNDRFTETWTAMPGDRPSEESTRPVNVPEITQTPTASRSDTPQPTPTLPCTELHEDKDLMQRVPGIIVLRDRNTGEHIFLHSSNDPKPVVDRLDQLDPRDLQISPDGEYILFRERIKSYTPPPVTLWEIVDREGGWVTTVEIPRWKSPKWLGSTHLIYEEEEGTSRIKTRSIYLIDPFSGEKSHIENTFPAFVRAYITPYWDGIHGLEFSPDGRYVVYPSDLPGYVVYDRVNQSIVCTLFSIDIITQPKWTMHGNNLAVAINDNPTSADYELYIFEPEGWLGRLTLWSELFDEEEIYNFEWSRNGEKIAFLFSSNPVMSPVVQPAIIFDFGYRHMEIYCLEGGFFKSVYETYPAPIWSPDDRYIVVELISTEGVSQVFLIDTEEKSLLMIAENATPIGWIR